MDNAEIEEDPHSLPKAVDGYYPLYHFKEDAEDASPDDSGAHNHVVVDDLGFPLDMWMPNGGTLGTDYFHGDYTGPEDDPYLDIAPEGTASPSESWDNANGDDVLADSVDNGDPLSGNDDLADSVDSGDPLAGSGSYDSSSSGSSDSSGSDADGPQEGDVLALVDGSGEVMFIEEVDPSTNQPTDTYMLIPVIESSVSGVYEFDNSRTSDVNLSESEATVKLGSDPTAVTNHAPGSTEFNAILAAEGASHSTSDGGSYGSYGSYYSVIIEAPADDDISFVTDIA